MGNIDKGRQMFKRLLMLSVTVAAVAFPAAALAANEPQLTEGGALIPEGSKTVATNVGDFIFEKTNGEEPQVTCTTVHLTGTLSKNKENTVEGSVTSAAFQGKGAVNAHNFLPECEAAGNFGNSYFTIANLPLTVKSSPMMGADTFQMTGSGSSKVKFIVGSTVAGACEYESTGAAITGTYTTAATAVLSTDNTQSGSGSKLIKGSFLCPTSGQLKLSFFLETDVSPFTELGIS